MQIVNAMLHVLNSKADHVPFPGQPQASATLVQTLSQANLI